MLISDINNYPHLTKAQAELNVQKYGKNKLKDTKHRSTLQIAFSQIKSPLVLLIIGVGIFSFIVGEVADTIILTLIVLINTVIGTIQHSRAQNAVDSLKSMMSSTTKVLREGRLTVVNTEEITIDDIVYLEAGDRIPADGVIVDANSLSVNESQLTGESVPVEKDNDQSLFMGSYVMSGKCLMKINKIGMNTEIGNISSEVSKKSSDTTPFEKQIERITKVMMILILVIFLIIVIVSLIDNRNMEDVIHTFVALGISVIPEGLPVVIAITLAFGAYKLSKKNAIMKNLPSVTTMAGVDVICSDKTGTLTEGKLSLSKILALNVNKLSNNTYLDREVIKLAVLCNGATVDEEKIGDYLDIAILEYAYANGFQYNQTRKEHQIIDEIPFDSAFKYQVTLHKVKGKTNNLLIVKGAADIVIEMCTNLNKDLKVTVIESLHQLSLESFKVIAIAENIVKADKITKKDLASLQFVGLLAFEDKIRPEVIEAIKLTQQSGLKTIMITGDHPITAKAVGMKIGIFNENHNILITGDEVNQANLKKIGVRALSIIARAKPENKVEVLSILRENKHIVAMTGDGVNDGPSLVESDIGIAMGFSGTDVAKESADMVLTDDNFNTIVVAINEARGIMQNVRKVIGYLFTTSIGESLLFIVAVLFGLTSPLLATQILFLNLITDGVLDVSLSAEKHDKDLLQKNVKHYQNKLIPSKLWFKIGYMGILMGIVNFIIYLWANNTFEDDYARTLLLLSLTVSQWGIAYSYRSLHKSSLFLNPLSNIPLIIALFVSATTTIAFIYIPFLSNLLGLVPLNTEAWVVAFIAGISIFVIEELRKYAVSAITLNVDSYDHMKKQND